MIITVGGHPADKVGGVNKWGKAALPVNSATWAATWAVLDGTDNAASPGNPDWSTVTQGKRVYLFDDLALDGINNGAGFTTSSSLSDAEGVFKVAQLFLVDSVKDGVTLTIHPGSTLSVQDSVAMINKDVGGTATPKIHLKSSANSSGQMFYGQIAPTAASLQGTYAYDLYIKNEDWHHIASPISSTLSTIQFSPGTTETFSFNYSAGTNTNTNESCNVFYWDVNKTGGSFWQPATATTDIANQPLTIFFSAAQVPCTMTITGTLPQVVRNPNTTLSYPAANTAVSGDTSSGYGAPNWVGSANKNGWNFYANPYLSYISTSQLMSNYSTSMTSLNTSLYAWRPNLNGINSVGGSSGNYLTHNGNTGDANAAQVPPFQAVFMQANGTGASSGLNVGKKARTTGILASVLNKQSNPIIALTLERAGNGKAPENIYLDVRETLEFTQNGRVRSDAPVFGTKGNVFAILSDSTFYKIKTVLYHVDSLHQKVCVTQAKPEAGLILRNHPDFDPNYVSFVYDRYTKKLINLSMFDYRFDNDVMSFDYRFDWFIIPQDNTSLIESMENPVSDQVWATTIDRGVVLQANEFWRYPTSEVNVYSLGGELILSKQGNVHNMFIPSRGKTEMVIIVIDDEVSIKTVLP